MCHKEDPERAEEDDEDIDYGCDPQEDCIYSLFRIVIRGKAAPHCDVREMRVHEQDTGDDTCKARDETERLGCLFNACQDDHADPYECKGQCDRFIQNGCP